MDMKLALVWLVSELEMKWDIVMAMKLSEDSKVILMDTQLV